MTATPTSLQEPLVSAAELIRIVEDDPHAVRVMDCRFNLMDPDAGEAAWHDRRIPGSGYLHLDRDLAGPVRAETGRHPLPDPEAFRATMGRHGIAADARVVFVDDAGGAMAARAWWLACHHGHPAAQVLSGGIPAWIEAGGAMDTSPPVPPPAQSPWPERPALLAAVSVADVQSRSDHETLIDARAHARFEGRAEPIDPVAGHIPGARCMPHTDNLDEAGHFLSASALRERWSDALMTHPNAIHSCGSGVTAAHNILAVVTAGFPAPRLYPGSWSEWIRDPTRPIATGPAEA